MRSLIGFLRKAHGVTTIEWVVLCAAVLFAALGISFVILEGADGLGGSVANEMRTAAGSN
jgi:Flp pilus assembly pilin Flp